MSQTSGVQTYSSGRWTDPTWSGECYIWFIELSFRLSSVFFLFHIKMYTHTRARTHAKFFKILSSFSCSISLCLSLYLCISFSLTLCRYLCLQIPNFLRLTLPRFAVTVQACASSKLALLVVQTAVHRIVCHFQSTRFSRNSFIYEIVAAIWQFIKILICSRLCVRDFSDWLCCVVRRMSKPKSEYRSVCLHLELVSFRPDEIYL